MSLAILFHFLCAQHASGINISIIRCLRLWCWITTSVVLFSVRCVLEIWCGWIWVVLFLQAEEVTSSWCFILQIYLYSLTQVYYIKYNSLKEHSIYNVSAFMKTSSGCNLKGPWYKMGNVLYYEISNIFLDYPFKDEAQTAVFKDPVRTAL